MDAMLGIALAGGRRFLCERQSLDRGAWRGRQNPPMSPTFRCLAPASGRNVF